MSDFPAIDRLTNVNIDVCAEAGCGHPGASQESLAAYDRILARCADEVRTLAAAARVELASEPRFSRGTIAFVDGIVAALERAIIPPRVA